MIAPGPMLSIKAYDAAELAAITHASYPSIRAFAPAAFSQVNFPTRVRDEAELIRYADIMYELADRDLWYCKTLYSTAEAAMMASLSDSIETLTESSYGRAIRPFMCLFPPMPILRTVTALARNRPLKIFEIGGGAGYLGAYLIKSGHRYIATDNTQALYLWQDRLFGTLAAAEFADLAFEPRAQARVMMMPWWEFAQLFRAPPDVDIVICEAAMGEMDPFAVNYITRLAAQMLARSPSAPFSFAISANSASIRWTMCVIGLPRPGSAASSWVRSLRTPSSHFELRGEAPPIGSGSLQPAIDFLPIDKSKLLEAYAFFDFIKLQS